MVVAVQGGGGCFPSRARTLNIEVVVGFLASFDLLSPYLSVRCKGECARGIA